MSSEAQHPAIQKAAQWAAQYGELLAICYGHFDNDGLWPELERLQHDVELTNSDFDVRVLTWTMPQALGFVERETLVLRVRALAYVPAAAPLLADWHSALVLAYKRWRREPTSTFSKSDLIALFCGDEWRVNRVGCLVLREGWAFGGGTGNETGDWSRAIHSQVRVARGTRTAADLLTARGAVEYPPQKTAAPKTSRTLLRRSWDRISRHPTWAQVIGGLSVAVVLASVTWLWKVVARVEDRRSQITKPATSRDQRPQWGPHRSTFRCNASARECSGADHVTINSTENNPAIGDERFFLSGTVKDIGGPVQDRLSVHHGDVVVLRMAVFNNAVKELTGAGASITQGLKARLEIPKQPASTVRLYGWLSADNAIPRDVFDSVILQASQPMRIEMVPGSGRLINRAHPTGLKLADDVAREGALLGYRRLNGRMSSCFCQGGYVVLDVKVHDA